ncbi:hypothetical protein JRO89_XS13G0077700 [Xanthoceras sorbifolium]|uniref:Uncharacterized protein n=1 Tax=Xanthoceras sorbifolium TaxID=99658 RepID=A0ABQ8H783_9ROSI|nr:hypothetical protein JRO89_XS13G0077700 [Xanthoceras sorbifolium]
MFGRVRAASSTLDNLELERAPSKLIKDDSLSIYEATLMKLKLGSQRNLDPLSEMAVGAESSCASADVPASCGDALSSPHHDIMMMDTDCSSASSLSSSSSDCHSTGSLKQHQSRNVSVLYLFSKYKNSGQVKEEDGSSVSPSSSECQSQGSTGRELERDGFSFLSCLPKVRVELDS